MACGKPMSKGVPMKLKPRSEMSKLLWSFTIPVLLLVTIIVGYYLIDGIVSANNNAKHTKQLLITQTFQSYNRIGENFRSLNFGPDLVKVFNPEVTQGIFSGQMTPLYSVIKNIMTLTSPVSYMAVVSDGKVVDSLSVKGITVDPNNVPKSPPQGEYKIVDHLGNMQGTIMEVPFTVDMSKFGLQGKFYVLAVYDLTKQVAAIDKYFNDQKQDTIIKLSITALVAVILFALLSTFWLRYLINRYIRRPVEKLNTEAEEIAAGTFQGEVVVDPDSDFAALQGLLRSGQLVLRKLEKDMGDKG
jgi:methyl-accepting chemotaxis protein